MQELTALDLFIGFIITWTIGLFFPVTIRYLIVKKPLKKKSATWAAVGLFFLNQIIFVQILAQDASPIPIFLIALVSYHILRKGHKDKEKKGNVKKQKEKV